MEPLISLTLQLRQADSHVVSTLKDWGQVAAWFGAALFFGYKVFSGYLFPDVALTVDCQRTRIQRTQLDFLAITVTAKKGERGAIQLHDARVALFDAHSRNPIGQPALLKGTRRLSYRTAADGVKPSSHQRMMGRSPCQ